MGDGVSLRLGAASPGSAIIESVFGNVELDVAERRNVEILVSSLVGEIRPLSPGFVRLKTDDGYLLKSGEGGASLSLSSGSSLDLWFISLRPSFHKYAHQL